MEIKNLGNIPYDRLFEAFSRAFEDYDIQLNAQQLRAMLRRRGFDPSLSFAAFDGEQIVAFTCNGIGMFNGERTAYDTGTGTVKEYRGQGLATDIFNHSIPFLKGDGVSRYLLEVLQHNDKAVSVYRKLGFETTREFYYFTAENAEVIPGDKQDSCCVVLPVGLDEIRQASHFGDFEHSWQNSWESIDRASGDFIGLGAYREGTLVGYGVFEPASGDMTQLAVERSNRRRGIGSMLFRKMVEVNRYGSVKIVNTGIGCDAVTAFLRSKNIVPGGRQFEMIKKL